MISPQGAPEVRIPQHTRAIPDEWPGLVAFAHQQLTTNGLKPEVSADSVVAVVGHIQDLSDERLEVNRYYGLGSIMLGMAQDLRLPAVRQRVVQNAGTSLAEEFVEHNDPLLPGSTSHFRLFDIHPSLINTTLHKLTRTASKRLPLGAQLVANALEYEADNRINRLEGQQQEEEAARFTREGLYIQLTHPAAMAVAKGTTDGTVFTMRNVLLAKDATLHADNHDPAGPPRNLLVTPADVRSLELAGVSARLASLRFDEFFDSQNPDGTNKLLDVDAAGKTRFIKDKVTAVPSDVTKGATSLPVLHDARLKCPALNVPGMMPLVRGLIPDILEVAQAEVARRY